MLEKITRIIKYIFISTIPSTFMYAASSDVIPKMLIKNNYLIQDNIADFQFYSFSIGTILTLVFTYFYSEESKVGRKINSYKKLNKIYLNKILDDFCRELNVHNDLHLRVFRIERKLFNNTTKIVNYHIDNSTDEVLGRNTLVFTHVKKEDKNQIEGLVGLCFDEEKNAVDYDSKKPHKYTLTREQKQLVGRVSFCCAAPIFKNKRIKYIVSLDSNTIKVDLDSLTLETANEIVENYLTAMSAVFDEFVLK